ncbi:replication protein A 70 kDa dna-binding subunit, partial [Trifolium medium]|nr:replication protein A 70 kDa dna-binding subunit [Trifolium medium]
MDATLEDLEGNRVHCTLWDDFALKMQQFLDTHDSSLPVIPEVFDYIERMNVANVELTQVVSQMTRPVMLSVADDLLQTPKMTIEDLIESTE